MKRMRVAVVGAVVVAVSAVGVGAAMGGGDGSSKEAEVAALFDTWNSTLATGDPQQVADRYATNAVLLPTVAGHVHDTRAEIVEYFQEKFLAKKPSGRITESKVRVLSDDLATHSGLYRFTFANPGDGPASVDARFTYVYAKQDGQWRILEHHSSKVPA